MHGDLRTRPLPYIYFTSTKPPFDFCSYNTQVNGKFSLKFQSQGLQRDSRSPFARVSRMGQPRIDGGPVLFRGKPVQRDSGSPSALSLAEDNRESMVDQYSSEDNQATGTPVPTSAVSLAGDGRVPIVEQCYPGDNKSAGTPVQTPAVSPAGDNREPLVAQCTWTFERDPSLTYTSRARNPPSIFAPTTRKSMGNFP